MMTHRPFSVLALLLLMLSLPLRATVEIRSKQLTTADGLANNSVRHLYQDSKGFIWMGTLNGLSRYDGNSFHSFYPAQDGSLSLGDHRIYDLTEDENGFLWICASPELYSCYDLKNARFVDYTGTGNPQQRYGKMLLTSAGEVWLWQNGNGALHITYNGKTFKSKTYKVTQGNIPSDRVTFVVEGCQSDLVWIGSEKGLVRVEQGQACTVDKTLPLHSSFHSKKHDLFFSKTNRIYTYDAATKKLRLCATLPVSNQCVQSGAAEFRGKWLLFTSEGAFLYDPEREVLESAEGLLGSKVLWGNVTKDNLSNLWIYNHTGEVWYLNRDSGQSKKFRLMEANQMDYIDYERYHIVHDSRGIIWISTYGNGLFAYEPQKEEMTHFKAGLNNWSHITTDFLLSVMEDRSGEIWVGTEFAGLSQLTVINEGSYRCFPEDPSLLDRSNTVRMLSRMKGGDIWVGTRKGGLYVYDANLNRKSAMKAESANIYAVMEDDRGRLWKGTRGKGLTVDKQSYRNSSSDPYSVANDNIFSLFRDHRGRMWICTFGGGLDYADETNPEKIRFHHFLNENYSQKQVRTAIQDRNRMMWVGTSDGVFVFHPDSLLKHPKQYYRYNGGPGKLRSNEVRTLLLDSQGNVWIGTSGMGLSRCRPGQDYAHLTFEHFDTSNGLAHNVVESLVEDRSGNLWIATEYGISKYNPRIGTFENFFFSSYAKGNVYSENSGCLCDNGHIIFGSNYGILMFDPQKVKKSVESSPAVFTNLKINGIDVLPDDEDSPLTRSLSYSDELELSYTQNSFVIDFASFNYADAGQTKYSYRLQGYDKEWSIPSQLNFASYKHLPYGEYTLEVKTCNSAGVWSSTISSLHIVVHPPFYLTGWAFLIYLFLVAAILYFVFRVMRNFARLHNRMQVEKQLTEYKLVFFTNISHEFRTPLTLIQGALERLQRLENKSSELMHGLQTMEKSTRRMLRLIDQLLEFRKMQNNKLALSLEQTDVVAMLYEIYLSFGDAAESKNMDFRFIPSASTYKMYVDKEKLDKITYNLLSNAFKYTPSDGKVDFSVYVDEPAGRLRITVRDTGVGIPKEKRDELFKRFMQSSFSGTSIGVGLHLTHELVQVHKGVITYEENPGGGSVFTVELPLSTECYEKKDFLIPTGLMQQEASGEKQDLEREETLSMDYFKDKEPLNQHKILIIEDDNEVRNFLKEELGHYFQVVTADNGEVGVQVANDADPSLIVCDVMMPVMNGYEATRKLKTEFATSHIPIILLTALSSPENHLAGIECGADAYLPKPFSVKLLLTRIIKLIEQRERLKEKFSSEPTLMRSAICSTELDKAFADKLLTVIEGSISHSDFSVDEFAAQMGIGRTVFYKKVKGVTGYSPNEYIRIIRMKKAAELLLKGEWTVSEVSYKVGIDDPFYFSKCFKAQFGVAPSVYQKQGI